MNALTSQEEVKKIQTLYWIFVAGTALSLVPHGLGAIASAVLLIGCIVAAYKNRKQEGASDFLRSHSSYLIKTFWSGSGIAAFSITFGGGLMLALIDHTPLDPCIHALAGMSNPEALANTSSLKEIFGPCYEPYMQANMNVFIISGLIAAGPPLLYVGYRIVKGVQLLKKSASVTGDTGWL